MQTKIRILRAIVTVAAVAVATGSAQTPARAAASFTYTFDAGQANFQSNFYRNGPSTNFTVQSSGGLTNSGMLRPPGTYDSVAALSEPIPNQAGTSVAISFYFRVNGLVPRGGGSTGYDSGESAGIGLVGSPTSSFRWDDAYGSLHTAIDRRSYSDTADTIRTDGLSLGTSAYRAKSSYGYSGSNWPSSLSPSTWYRLTQNIDILGTQIRESVVLEDMGTTGAAVPTTVLASNPALFNNPFLGESVYAGLSGGTSGGIAAWATAVDNFSVTVVPEPATLSVLALGGGLTLLRRRRR